MSTQAPLSNEEARQLADSITHGAEYQIYLDPKRPHKPSDWERVLKQIGDQLQEWWDQFRELFHLKEHMQKKLSPPWTEEAMQWGLRALIVLLALVALYALVRWGLGVYKQYRLQRDAEKQHPVITLEARQQQKIEYLQLAEAAFNDQQYREAIHYLFLAAVTQVISHEQFHASKELTNREIITHCDFSQCVSPESAIRHFQHLVHHDERNWFGYEPVKAGDYKTMQAEYQSFTESLGVLEVHHA